MEIIAVLGAGTMGNGIAQVFAQAGFEVHLIDISDKALDNAMATIEKNLGRMVTKGAIADGEVKNIIARIQPYSDMSEAVIKADLVVEAATEDIALKMNLFRALDEATPDHTILATNTSSISITRIAAATKRAERVIGMHFMNPVPIMKLVEIIRGYSTTDDVASAIVDLTHTLGKVPTLVNDYPGFVSNRILLPMINEAIETLHQGVAGVVEIDTVMKLGMAHPMGPLQLADFIGLDVCLSILNVLYDGFKLPKYAPSPLLVNMVSAGKLGVKSGEGFYDYSVSRKAETVSAQFA